MNHFLISLAAVAAVRLSMCGSDSGTVPGQDGGADGGADGWQCCDGRDPDGMMTDDIVPPDRLPLPGTWESAGVEGGIPARMTICAEVTMAPYNADKTGAASAVSAIQRAIDMCPDGQVVMVPSGTYKIDNGLNIKKAITLRGAGAATVFQVTAGTAVHIGGLGPWPPPKSNDRYRTPITGGATRASTTVNIADTSMVAVGRMIMVDENDDPALVWTKPDAKGRFRASMHMVDSKTPGSVTFHPALPIDFKNAPQLSWFPDLTHDAGVEGIKFVGTGTNPGLFMNIFSAWNVWVTDCEFTAMPSRTIMVAWSGHVELRKNFMHDQSSGGPNSEGLDLFCDTNWSLVVDNICIAGGFPQINIGDGGPNPYYSGGFGNVIAYNYAVDAFYTDPPTSPNAGKMPADIGTNHSPHTQFNLVEGNVMGKFGVDAYHGSGSHTLLFRNSITGKTKWTTTDHATTIQIDRRNLHYSIVGNVLGIQGMPPTMDYATTSNWKGSTIYRLGFPDGGNDGYSGTFPPSPLRHADGGSRDLFVDRTTMSPGTTLIEGNWDAVTNHQDFSAGPKPMPGSYYLKSRPAFFKSLAWPPVDPSKPVTNDPTIIPAGYRAIKGVDPPQAQDALLLPALLRQGTPRREPETSP